MDCRGIASGHLVEGSMIVNIWGRGPTRGSCMWENLCPGTGIWQTGVSLNLTPLTTNSGLGPDVYISGQEFPNKTPGNNSPKACLPGRETLWMDSKTAFLIGSETRGRRTPVDTSQMSLEPNMWTGTILRVEDWWRFWTLVQDWWRRNISEYEIPGNNTLRRQKGMLINRDCWV